MTPSRRPRAMQRRRGISFVETLAVAAVSMVLLAQAPSELAGLRSGARLASAAALLEADLNLARETARRGGRDVRLTLERLDDGGSCYVVWRGVAAAGCTCDGSGRATCEADADVLRTERQTPQAAIQAGAAERRTLVFSAAFGTVTPTATFSVADGRGREARRIINVVGRVRSCQRGIPADGPRCA